MRDHSAGKSVILNYIVFSFLWTDKEISSLRTRPEEGTYPLFFQTFLHNWASWFEFRVLGFVRMYDAWTLRMTLPQTLSACSMTNYSFVFDIFVVDTVLSSASILLKKMKEFFSSLKLKH